MAEKQDTDNREPIIDCRIQTIRHLLAHPDVAVNQMNGLHTHGISALMMAAERGDVDVVKELLNDSRTDINLGTTTSWTVLIAAPYDKLEVAQKYNERSGIHIFINVQNKDVWSAIMIGSKDAKFHAASFFRQEGIQVTICPQIAWTALMFASFHGHSEVVSILLNHPSINVDQRDAMGTSALMVACSRNDISIVRQILAHSNRIDFSKTNINQFTPLTFACRFGHVGNGADKVVRLLLAQTPVNINQKTSKGSTALMMATAHANARVVKALLSRSDIDLAETNDHKQTALDIASKDQHSEVFQYLTCHLPEQSKEMCVWPRELKEHSNGMVHDFKV